MVGESRAKGRREDVDEEKVFTAFKFRKDEKKSIKRAQ